MLYLLLWSSCISWDRPFSDCIISLISPWLNCAYWPPSSWQAIQTSFAITCIFEGRLEFGWVWKFPCARAYILNLLSSPIPYQSTAHVNIMSMLLFDLDKLNQNSNHENSSSGTPLSCSLISVLVLSKMGFSLCSQTPRNAARPVYAIVFVQFYSYWKEAEDRYWEKGAEKAHLSAINYFKTNQTSLTTHSYFHINPAYTRYFPRWKQDFGPRLWMKPYISARRCSSATKVLRTYFHSWTAPPSLQSGTGF